MANFLEKLLSGKYPAVEGLWRSEFGRLVDEALKTMPTEDLDEAKPEEEMTVERLSELLALSETQIEWLNNENASLEDTVEKLEGQLEALARQYDLVRTERAELRYKLDAVQHALRSNVKRTQQ